MSNKIMMEFSITPQMYIFALAWVNQAYILPKDNKEDLDNIVKQFIKDNGFEPLVEQNIYLLDDFEENANIFLKNSKETVLKIAPELF